MARKITVLIDEETAALTVEVDGVQGDGCLKLTESLLRDLGGQAVTKAKPDLYVTQAQTQNRLKAGH